MAEDDFAEETIDEEGVDSLEDAELDEDELEDEELEDSALGVETFEETDDFDDESEEKPPSKRQTVDVEDDDDDEDVDPADVEADLDAILKDRLATPDDEDEEPENAVTGVKPADVTSKREDEFVCSECFLVVNQSQFGSKSNPRCPMGDPDCPSMALLFGS